MEGGEQVREQFGTYSQEIDADLQALFVTLPKLEMYGHMAYFMGFADEELKPAHIYGGKRFRSSLALMLGDWYGVKEKVRPAAVALEVFHNFTLIHDDIVDGDDLRRGRPTVWKLFGEDHAINSGDAQLLLSLQNITDAEALSAALKVKVQSFFLQQFLRVAEGQFLDFTLTKLPLTDTDVTPEAYLTMIGRKTSDLVAAATGVTGIVAELDESEQRSLFEFGYNLGLAYQLCDDLVSIWGTNQQTGKREYGDLIEKKKTLPIMWLCKKLDGEERAEVEAMYAQEESLSINQIETLVAFLERENIYAAVYEESNSYATKARNAVDALSLPEDKKINLNSFIDLLLPDIKNQ